MVEIPVCISLTDKMATAKQLPISHAHLACAKFLQEPRVRIREMSTWLIMMTVVRSVMIC